MEVQPRRTLLLALLLGVIAVCAYAPAMGGDYIFDDRLLIEENPFVHSFSWWTRWFTTEFWDLGLTHVHLAFYRPLVTATYAIEWAAGLGQPDLFHVMNLLWHAAASVLAFYALQRWTGSTLPALLAALLFAVHPTKAESVAWISGRPDPMCLVFLLVASAGAARRLRQQRHGLTLEVVGTIGAYLSKEAAILLPALVVIEAWVAAGRPAFDIATVRRLLPRALPQLAVAVVYLGLRSAFLPFNRVSFAEQQVHSLTGRPKLVLATFGHALDLIVAPRNLHVQRGLFTYDAQGELLLSWSYIVLGATFLIGLAVAIIHCRRRVPVISVGLLLFLVAFLPTSNLRPTGYPTIISDRFLYIPLLGIALALAGLWELWRSRRPLSLMPLAMTGAAASGLAFGSLTRSADYLDEEAYWTRELEVNPISLEAMHQKIRILNNQGKYAEALTWFQRSHAASRAFRDPRIELGFFTSVVELLAFLTPDSERQEQQRIVDFYERLIDARPGEVSLVHSKARMHFAISPTQSKLLRESRPTLRMSEARLLARMGNDAEALRLVKASLEECKGCRRPLAQAPLIAAAAGDYALAERLFDRYMDVTGDARGIESSLELVRQAAQWAPAARRTPPDPAAIRARAMELSTLGCFGRAYEVMQPHEAAFLRVPDVALGYAELAWRAGHTETARRVLSTHVTERQVAETTARWDVELGRARSHSP